MVIYTILITNLSHAGVKGKSVKETDFNPHRRGFGHSTRIAPGGRFTFYYENQEFVYVTIFSKSGSKIRTFTGNTKIPKDTNLIVEKRGYLHYAKHGQLWIDTDGVNHWRF